MSEIKDPKFDDLSKPIIVEPKSFSQKLEGREFAILYFRGQTGVLMSREIYDTLGKEKIFEIVLATIDPKEMHSHWEDPVENFASDENFSVVLHSCFNESGLGHDPQKQAKINELIAKINRAFLEIKKD